jgi:hypothetical protein
MLASRQLRLIKGQYYTDGFDLFFVKDIVTDKLLILVEDCKTNKASWVSMEVASQLFLSLVMLENGV